MELYPHRNLFLIGDFVRMQRQSFCNFLERGLTKEFSKIRTIRNLETGMEVLFYPEQYLLTQPKHSPKEAILNAKTYESKIYVPAQLTNIRTGESTTQWVLLGGLPLMTKRGHFVVNGTPWVVVNQMVRTPGIYFQKRGRVFYADIVASRGAWVRLEARRGKLWARMKRAPRIPLPIFCLAFGTNIFNHIHKIPYADWPERPKKADIDAWRENLIYWERPPIGLARLRLQVALSEVDPRGEEAKILRRRLKNEPIKLPKTFAEADRWIQNETKKDRLLKAAKLEGEETDRKMLEMVHLLDNPPPFHLSVQSFRPALWGKLGNPKRYQLGEAGRLNLNSQLGNKVASYITFLTPSDLVLATEQLMARVFRARPVDDRDNLKNRKVRTSGELIQHQWLAGLLRLERLIRKGLNCSETPPSLPQLVTTKPIVGVFREFFGPNPLCQYMDQTNPLAEITHKRRVSLLGAGGLSRDTADIKVRGIHSTYYGRICPIETPEGKNAGLVHSLTVFAGVNRQGLFETPLHRVSKSQSQVASLPVSFFTANEQLTKVSPGDVNLALLKENAPVKLDTEFEKVEPHRVDFLSVSPLQMISVATSLIPFLEHDDANRALMGSNMQRQAIPVVVPDRPLVGTGLEGKTTADSGHVTQAMASGCVSFVSSDKIVVYSGSFAFDQRAELIVSDGWIKK